MSTYQDHVHDRPKIKTHLQKLDFTEKMLQVRHNIKTKPREKIQCLCQKSKNNIPIFSSIAILLEIILCNKMIQLRFQKGTNAYDNYIQD